MIMKMSPLTITANNRECTNGEVYSMKPMMMMMAVMEMLLMVMMLVMKIRIGDDDALI